MPNRLSVRLQPNHPADDPTGVAASVLDGLLMGAGDAVIGIKPAGDDIGTIATLLAMLDEIRQGLAIPTQGCVLTHIINTIELIGRGAPVDLCFQSIAGRQAVNRGFGIDLALLREGHEATLALGRGTVGQDVMYFETGQGSCLSADAHHGVDQQTLECRAYAVAQRFRPLLVNSVVGFIGPEYLHDGKQILRAALEDHCCGKLLGPPMGLDICYTNHAEMPEGAFGATLAGHTPIEVRSRAPDRATYLLRPDLGRRLDPADAARIDAGDAGDADVAIVIADGLSAAIGAAALARLAGWSVAPIVVAHQARVAIGDEIGAALGARLAIVLIGERPGLSAADGVGTYLTWVPRIGRLDSERNCVSNIRPGGLAIDRAATLIAAIAKGARALGVTGVRLKIAELVPRLEITRGED